MVCAHECEVMDEVVVMMKLSELLSRACLCPVFPHPAQVLIDGLLLTAEDIHRDAEGLTVDICSLCLCQLQDGLCSNPPQLVLANGLWVGSVLMGLEVLTFLEQLLVSLLYSWCTLCFMFVLKFTMSRVYIFKLFLKKNG